MPYISMVTATSLSCRLCDRYSNMNDLVTACLYKVKVGNEIHTIFEAPDKLNDDSLGSEIGSVANIVMIDVSGSMFHAIGQIQTSWNSIIAPLLLGRAQIFTFGSEIKFRRNDPIIKDSDFDNSGTDLTGAIKQIRLEIEKCAEDFIRVFLVTDGEHNATPELPDTEIKKLSIPSGKTIEVYLLGIGFAFPVEYSINIRSVLHNGNANVPSLFWETGDDYDSQMYEIRDILQKGFVELNISKPGHLCPGHMLVDKIHLGEFMYYMDPPNELYDVISLTRRTEDSEVKLKDLNLVIKDIDFRFLLDKVFRQWNSIIIQEHRNKKDVPILAFEVMDKIYEDFKIKLHAAVESIGNTASLHYRLAKKDTKFLEVEYATLMNQSKTVIGLEGKFSSEIELAETILKTTVKSKYNAKTLKMRGQGTDEYAEDIKKFQEIYNKNKEAIMALPEPAAEECCNVTFGSIVRDLQDPCFLQLLTEDKFTFMKTFCIPGIPVYAPVKDSSQINVWTLEIKHILVTPYNLISQSTLELSAELGSGTVGQDKDIYLQEGDENSRFNAVIPVFSFEVGEVLKPLVRSNLFATVATFSILKNPHIIDMHAHMAALGSAFMKTIAEYPKKDRPEFVKTRLSLIEATGKLYMDRKGYAEYITVLFDDPANALMTESKKTYEGQTIKCESLVKPAFFLYLAKDKIKENIKLKLTLKLMCIEFVGRCLAKYAETTPFSDHFVPELSTKDKRKTCMDEKIKELVKCLLQKFIASHGDLLQTFFKPEDLRQSLKVFFNQQFKEISGALVEISINMEKLNKLKNPSSVGDVSWTSLEAFANEMELPGNDVADIFSNESAFVYVHHALLHKSSSERLAADIVFYDQALINVKKAVESENFQSLKILSRKMVLEEAESQWREQFMVAHRSLVQPLTEEEIIQKATQKGIIVDSSSFKTIYKYNPKTGLTRNACMIEYCPHFLRPDRTYNQHISVERHDGFPHRLHKISLDTAMKNGSSDDVIEALLSGSNGGVAGRKSSITPSLGNLEAVRNEVEFLIQLYKKFIGNTNEDLEITASSLT